MNIAEVKAAFPTDASICPLSRWAAVLVCGSACSEARTSASRPQNAASVGNVGAFPRKHASQLYESKGKKPRTPLYFPNESMARLCEDAGAIMTKADLPGAAWLKPARKMEYHTKRAADAKNASAVYL